MQGNRILLVDDDELVLWTVGKVLERRGDDYVKAYNGIEALEILSRQDFDILITDLNMPEMDGIELVQRARIIRPRIVSMVLTGAGTRENVLKAMQQGVFDFIDKPVLDIDAFSMAIERAASQSRVIRQRDELMTDLKQQNARLEVSLSQLRDAFARLQVQEGRLEDDLSQAQRLHQRLLPADFPPLPGFDFHGFYCPCERLGGDFFGVIPLGPRKMALYLADVAGHGVGAAMITVIIRELIHAQCMLYPDTRVFHSPSAALTFINQGLLEEEFDPPILVTMVYAVANADSGEITAACAGHPPPILVTAPGRVSYLPAHGPVLGIRAPAPFVPARFSLGPGDFMLMYSDGLTEARNALGNEFTDQRLCHTLGEAHGMRPRQIGRTIETDLRRHKGGAAAEDDETYLVVARTAPDAEQGYKSRTDIRSPRSALPPEAPACRVLRPDSRLARLLSGWDADGTVFMIRLEGKATWRQANAFVSLLAEAAEKNQEFDARLDLNDCQFMDSTFLGLIHQNAARLTIHGPSKWMRNHFIELGVLEELSIDAAPAPEIALTAATPDEDIAKHEALILSAHEALMDVSEENRKKFRDAVDLMRRKSNRES